jgi:hypothetical protein
MQEDLEFGGELVSLEEEIEWWEIEREPAAGGTTHYGVSIGGAPMTRGHDSLFAAINQTLAVLAQHSPATAGGADDLR